MDSIRTGITLQTLTEDLPVFRKAFCMKCGRLPRNLSRMRPACRFPAPKGYEGAECLIAIIRAARKSFAKRSKAGRATPGEGCEGTED